MYTKEVENLKLGQILSLVENIIERNLVLYLSAVIVITAMSQITALFINGNIYIYIIMILVSGMFTLSIKIITLKNIKVDKIDNGLIVNRTKKGNVFKQILMFLAFYIVACVILGIAISVFGILLSVLLVPDSIITFISVVIGIPGAILFSLLVSGIEIEVFCKNEIHHFISNSYNNIFKSKNETIKKLIIGLILLMLSSMIISLPVVMAQGNTLGMFIMTILSSCLGVIGWTYTYVVYMTSITEKDLLKNQDNQENKISNETNSTINNASGSEEITRLW